jgi:hypothetical protein
MHVAIQLPLTSSRSLLLRNFAGQQRRLRRECCQQSPGTAAGLQAWESNKANNKPQSKLALSYLSEQLVQAWQQ